MINLKVTVFLILLLPLFSWSQKIINGTVLNKNTSLPVEGASVYFNNTSIGTSANSSGQFSLQLTASLQTELIISAVGYQLLVFNTEELKPGSNTLVFTLEVKEQELRDVLILTDAVRKKYLSIFEQNFLGLTEEASRSKIENRKNIYFTSGEGNHSFRAYSDTPLVIINKMLGYKISFELIDFLFDEKTGRTYYYGYTRFEELGQKERWLKNRKRCYFGSTIHFYRSLITDRLKEENYQIYLVKPVKTSTEGTKGIAPPKMDMAVSITAKQIITADTANSNNYNITFNGKLMVQYDKDPTSKKYLKDHVFLQGGMPVGYRAFIHVKSPSISINKVGVINNPMDVEYSGYWIYEKAANMLPFNYTLD